MPILRALHLALVFLSGVSLSLAQDKPAPGQVTISGVTVSVNGPNGPVGSGSTGSSSAGSTSGNGDTEPRTKAVCRKNSVGTTMATDNSFMTLIFDDMSAQIGGTAPPVRATSACDVEFQLNTPTNWTFAIDTCDYRGYCRLGPGVTATLSATYQFDSQSRTAELVKHITGPMNTDFLIHQTGEESGRLWSPCGQPTTLHITMSLSLTSTNPNSLGLLITDSVDASRKKFNQTLSFGWKRCYSGWAK